MKKLLVAQAIAIALSMAIVIIGSIMGGTRDETTPFVVLVATAGGIIVAFVVLVATASSAAVAAGASVVVFVCILIIATGVSEDLKIRHWKTFLSFLGEAIAIWAIFTYGPTLMATIR